jgi:hypothetical protein
MACIRAIWWSDSIQNNFDVGVGHNDANNVGFRILAKIEAATINLLGQELRSSDTIHLFAEFGEKISCLVTWSMAFGQHPRW